MCGCSFLTLPLQQLVAETQDANGEQKFVDLLPDDKQPHKLLYDIYTSGSNEEKALVKPIVSERASRPPHRPPPPLSFDAFVCPQVRFFEAVRYEMFHRDDNKSAEKNAEEEKRLGLFNDVDNIHETPSRGCAGWARTTVSEIPDLPVENVTANTKIMANRNGDWQRICPKRKRADGMSVCAPSDLRWLRCVCVCTSVCRHVQRRPLQ